MGNGALPLVVQMETYNPQEECGDARPGQKVGIRLSVMEKRTVSKAVAVEMFEQEKLFFCEVRGPKLSETAEMAIDELRKWTSGFIDVIDSSIGQMRMLLTKDGSK